MDAARGDPEFIPDQSIVLFTFRADNDGADGIAARVYVMKDVGNADEVVQDRYIYQNRDSKRSVGENATLARKKVVYTTAELKARVKAGEGYESVVHANLTYVSSDTNYL